MKWIVLAILFVNGIPVNDRVFLLDPAEVKTRDDCMKELAKMKSVAEKRGADVFLECIDVNRVPPKFKKEQDS